MWLSRYVTDNIGRNKWFKVDKNSLLNWHVLEAQQLLGLLVLHYNYQDLRVGVDKGKWFWLAECDANKMRVNHAERKHALYDMNTEILDTFIVQIHKNKFLSYSSCSVQIKKSTWYNCKYVVQL